MSNYLVEIAGLYKRFNDNEVLRGIDFSLKKGETFAIVGGNGAGKSTMMKIITGLYQADRGTMKIKGQALHFHHPQEAHRHGIYLVPQEPLIFPNMSVEENITIGMKGKRAELRKKVNKIIDYLGWNLGLFRSAMTLSIAEQQLVEIVRGLVREADILILDEPTSTLTFNEIESLFTAIKRLNKDGVGVIYITHRFAEIFQLADSVAVLKDGVVSLKGPVEEFDYDRLLDGLVDKQSKGERRNMVNLQSNIERVKDKRNPILVVDQLTGHGFEEISFSISPGEVLGIAGVVGAGRTELAESIIGINGAASGEIELDGTGISRLSIRQRINLGMSYVPEDRHQHGIFKIASIQQNTTSAILHRLKGFFLQKRREIEITDEYVDQLKIKVTNTNQLLSELSGGNQQKVVLGKYLATKPKLLILDEPTRGIDAHARSDIYDMISQLQANGLAVLLISSDLEEIVKLSGRVLVMHEGKMIEEINREYISVDRITSAAFGVVKKCVIKQSINEI
ncbi:sugar ABC transporter ATP-binding protein [Cytobacillus purgationiresistens]|uniref:Autoinducer 2 import ATP-binding protein LsrA n=1 Tax=Cytobacillus purgationiresistens TaxID=863449 RepID=A0ABU0AE74_9BACI|nr:ATP-binding cassette domain-containing protein [Cytobacillus purgationiresistens]MDQ0269179.1 AI-2 transport system ATP-binding protein [Cytobacillus purgationiresistens]